MERKSIKARRVPVLLAAMLTASAAIAATLSINAGAYPYNTVPAASGIGVSSEGELRVAALTALTGAYRTAHGVASVSVGDIVDVTYGDGSKEKGTVVCSVGSVCTQPVPGTQISAPGGSGGGGGGGSEGSGGNGGTGTAPGSGSGGGLGDCHPPACTVTVG